MESCPSEAGENPTENWQRREGGGSRVHLSSHTKNTDCLLWMCCKESRCHRAHTHSRPPKPADPELHYHPTTTTLPARCPAVLWSQPRPGPSCPPCPESRTSLILLQIQVSFYFLLHPPCRSVPNMKRKHTHRGFQALGDALALFAYHQGGQSLCCEAPSTNTRCFPQNLLATPASHSRSHSAFC